MSFYLVTYTSLVEALDEAAAAEKAIGDVRSGGPISVIVKFDEVTSKTVQVAASLSSQSRPPIKDAAMVSKASSESSLASEPSTVDTEIQGSLNSSVQALLVVAIGTALLITLSLLKL